MTNESKYSKAEFNAAIIQYTTDCKMDIDELIESGELPDDIACFADIHDHVDANMLGGTSMLVERYDMDFVVEVMNAAHPNINAWLANGRDWS